jgi:hypothetical protein
MALYAFAPRSVIESLKSALLNVYLGDTGLELSDIYVSIRSCSDFLEAMNIERLTPDSNDQTLRRAIGHVLHMWTTLPLTGVFMDQKRAYKSYSQ